MLDNPNEPVSDLSYFDCLDVVVEKSQVGRGGREGGRKGGREREGGREGGRKGGREREGGREGGREAGGKKR